MDELHRAIFWPLNRLLGALRQWSVPTSVAGEFDGIQLAEITLGDEPNKAFVETTHRALELVRDADPRRYRRIRTECSYIVNTYLPSGGDYSRTQRACRVDFEKYDCLPESPNKGWWLVVYAATLVHEATHGYLDSRGVPYNRDTNAWCERMCVTEARRFVARWSAGRYDVDDFVRPFRPERWQKYWRMRFPGYILAFIRRIRSRVRPER